MYINTFKYTPKDVSCQLCTEYVKKLGCTALRCPWLAERIEAGVVGYREAVLETFPHERRLFQRLNLLIKHYPGSLWSNEQHERRMQYQCAVQGYRRRRDKVACSLRSGFEIILFWYLPSYTITASNSFPFDLCIVITFTPLHFLVLIEKCS